MPGFEDLAPATLQTRRPLFIPDDDREVRIIDRADFLLLVLGELNRLGHFRISEVYLIDRGQKRHVTWAAVMEKYNFRWPTTRVDQILLTSIPTGNPIT